MKKLLPVILVAAVGVIISADAMAVQIRLNGASGPVAVLPGASPTKIKFELLPESGEKIISVGVKGDVIPEIDVLPIDGEPCEFGEDSDCTFPFPVRAISILGARSDAKGARLWNLGAFLFDTSNAENGDQILGRFDIEFEDGSSSTVEQVILGVNVPEPSTAMLLAVGLAGLTGLRRQRGRFAH